MTKKCSVEGCMSGAKRNFKFPDALETKRFLKWLAATGNKSLLGLTTESLRNRTVCIDHFESKFILAKRLATTAVPTLHLPEHLDVSSYSIEVNKENVPRKSKWKAISPMPSQVEAKWFQEQSVPESNVMQPNVIDTNNDCGVLTGAQCDREHKATIGLKRKRESISSTIFRKRVRENRATEGTLLSFFNLSRKANMSPKEKQLYNVIARLRKSLRETQKHKVSLRTRLKHAAKFVQDGVYESLAELPEASRNFLISYFRNVKRDKYHRQYTIKDKVFALALYKRSTGAYRFMQEILSLPSIETLRKLINTIPIEPGFCNQIFEALSDKISRSKDERSQYCILAFDETSLEPSLSYNVSTGSIEGFVDTGYERKAQIANHAMVWMLKGVLGNWKQPIYYSFCDATSKWEDIARTFKDIVREARKFGLKIIASVCDQGATNVKAIKNLIESSKRFKLQNDEVLRHDVIVVEDQVIVPLFDPPHLMKCIRNNLLTKDVRFTLTDKIERVAKWSHIRTAYEIDVSSTSLRAMKKISDYHVIEEKIPKMKVKYCTQIFSNNVASVMSLMSRSNTKSVDGKITMPSEGENTAKLMKIMNDLFDSVNGGLTERTMTLTTVSNDEWNEYIDILRSMTFVQSKPGDQRKPIVLNNFITTLQGFKFLKNYLSELGFKKFSTRVFNQDAVENFFGQIKQQGMRDVKPNCCSFHAHYRTLLLKSFSQKQTRSNCEIDETSDFLVDLEKILSAPISEKPSEFPSTNPGRSMLPYNQFKIDSKKFVGSIQPFSKKCKTCQDNADTVKAHCDAVLVQFDGIALYYVSHFIHVKQFGKMLMSKLINNLINIFQFHQCEHVKDFHRAFVEKYIEKIIGQYLRKINRTQSGKESISSGTKDSLILQADKLHKNRTHRRTNKALKRIA